MAGLNLMQARFVAEYLVDLNATQAAIRAGYSGKTAYSQGQRLLNHVEIQKAIERAQQKRETRTGITAERVLKELAAIGFNVEAERATDRLKALELIGRHLAMFTDKSEVRADVAMSANDRALLEKVSKRIKDE